MSNKQKMVLIAGIAAVTLVLQFGFNQPTWAYIIIAISGGILALSMFIEMIQTLREGRYGVDLLAITAIIATLAVGDHWAALIILVMLIGGDALEDYASDRASSELKQLIARTPNRTRRKTVDGWEEIETDAVKIGDRLLVRPGEVVPVDSHVADGSSWVDESSLTGESRPIEKVPDDTLLSGSVNGDNALEVIADKRSEDSQYQALVRLVKESENRPARFVRLADRYAVPFTLIAYLIGGIAWFVSSDPVRFAQVMVVASPCPLILAAPIALVGGMSRSSRHGMIVKSGETLEKLEQAKTVAFDKTGTLTRGTLAVDEVHVDNPAVSKADFVSLVAGIEQSSTHIIARSVLAYSREQNIKPRDIEQIEEHVGAGLTGTYDGHTISCGKATFANYDHSATMDGTALYLSVDGTPTGWIRFEDVLRPESANVIETLRAQHVNDIVMLTGDRHSTANTIAEALRVDHVESELLPQDKINYLDSLEKDQRPVCMVGDGVNDAPALAIADVGIAMGAHGATAASESADAVILRDDLSGLNQLVTISKQTMNTARQSVWIGIAVCLVLMVIASTGIIPTLLGAIFQEGIDLISILWSVRALADR